jgi:MFS transporter, ACS family, aldohexuronate transporter
MTQIRNLRWWIAGLLALATALGYLDRQSFPVAVNQIREDIPLTDQQFSLLNSLFLLAYAIMYMGGGRIIDWLGTRAGYAVMIVWWSAANFLHGTVSTVTGLGVYRFLLGMGEGGGFPGSGKAVAEWFPPKERSFAFGIFNTGRLSSRTSSGQRTYRRWPPTSFLRASSARLKGCSVPPGRSGGCSSGCWSARW